MTYGIIFFEINSDTKYVYVYLKRNSNEEYQDNSIYKPDENSILNNICVLYYIKNAEYNHITFLLDIIKYSNLFDKYKNNLEKINYNIFNQKNFHNNVKHRRIKNYIIKKELDAIIFNYKLIKKFRHKLD